MQFYFWAGVEINVVDYSNLLGHRYIFKWASIKVLFDFFDDVILKVCYIWNKGLNKHSLRDIRSDFFVPTAREFFVFLS